MSTLVNLLDAGALLSAYGWIGIAVVMFAETGLLIGFFLPGDTLLFTAGLLCTSAGSAAHAKLSLPLVLLAAVFGALAGAQVGHLLGQRGGQALLRRSNNKHLLKGIARAEEILARYGHGKAIVIARFIPVVRTVLNPLAGAVGVPARTFAYWQILGGTVWSAGLVTAGYALGNSVPNVDRYLLPIVFVILLISVTPICLELLKARRSGASALPAEPDREPWVPLADNPYAYAGQAPAETMPDVFVRSAQAAPQPSQGDHFRVVSSHGFGQGRAAAPPQPAPPPAPQPAPPPAPQREAPLRGRRHRQQPAAEGDHDLPHWPLPNGPEGPYAG